MEVEISHRRQDPLKTHTALFTLLHRKGVDVRYGRLLPSKLRDSGLVNVRAEGRVFMWSGASPFADHHKANFDQLRRDMVETGLITEESSSPIARDWTTHNSFGSRR